MSSCLWAETLFPVVWAPMLFHNVVVFDGAHGFPRRPGQQYLPDSSLPQCRHPLCHGTPGHPLCLGAPASNIFQMAFRHGAPTSNKPHPAEKSTPVWLAIWRTWAGFANSQHRDSTFATPDNICAHSSLLPRRACCSDRRKSFGPSTPIAYATSVSPPNEAIARPGHRYWVANDAAAWPGGAFLQITARANPCSRDLWGT